MIEKITPTPGTLHDDPKEQLKDPGRRLRPELVEVKGLDRLDLSVVIPTRPTTLLRVLLPPYKIQFHSVYL